METKRRKGILKKGVYGLIILLIISQFVPVDRENPESLPEKDFLTMVSAPREIAGLVRTACYDCHSHQTEWPWYSYVTPVKFVVAHHVEEGREHLNFSKWAEYEQKKRDHKLEECAEEVKEGEMPIFGYDWTHAGARLSEADRQKLVLFFSAHRMDI
ncbi:MAG: heme-binding domain-containing protein [Bacteroidota bacterium]|nr:heme-binding domain-containing protein [Bacteroidota bacterium]MDX5427675.1 heme-binding domain-containing protein [Bacteroidota bacterium]MDX5448665.1 heme-binding domain-containing protein [Bacteroidota bacterium]MDX5505574.1 heme-binding domain-containing protein [Bacteroidota bacterium]